MTFQERSVWTLIMLCDGIGCNALYAPSGLGVPALTVGSAATLKTMAEADGWTIDGGCHLCPRCKP